MKTMKLILTTIFMFCFLTNLHSEINKNDLVSEYYYVSSKNGIPLRYQPDLNSKFHTSLGLGYTLNVKSIVSGDNISGNWVKVKYFSKFYYVPIEKLKSSSKIVN